MIIFGKEPDWCDNDGYGNGCGYGYVYGGGWGYGVGWGYGYGSWYGFGWGCDKVVGGDYARLL